MIREALDAYVEKNKRVFGLDRLETVGASEIGLCARRVAYAKKQPGLGVEGGWGASVRGTIMEDAFWYPALKAKYGDRLKRAGPEQESLALGRLSATPDGVLTGLKRDALAYLGVKDIRSSCIMVECKTIDPRVNLKEAKSENEFQVQVQMGLIRELTEHRPHYALITYTDASFWDELDEFAVKFDPGTYAAAKTRALTIFGVSDPTELKPEGWIAGGKECEYCPYAKPCGHERRRVPTGKEPASIDPQFEAEIMDLCREANAHRKVGDSATEKFKDMQVQIKARLRDKGIRKVPGVVSWSEVKGRTTIDVPRLQEKLAEVGIDLGDYEKTGDPSDRFQILLP